MHDHSRSRRSVSIDSGFPRLAGPALAALVFVSGPAPAADLIGLHVDSWQGGGYALDDVTVGWDPAAGRLRLAIGASTVNGAPAASGLELLCGSFDLGFGRLSCRDGSLRVSASPVGALSGHAEFEWRDRQLRFSLRRLDIAAASVELNGRWHSGAAEFDVKTGAMDLAALQRLLAALDLWPFAELQDLDGTLAVEGSLAFEARSLQSFSLSARTRGLAFLGVHAAEDLNAALELAAERRAASWSGRLRAEHSAGTFYVEPGLTVAGQPAGFTVEAPAEPLRVALAGAWLPESGRLQLDRLDYRHPGVAEGHAEGKLALPGAATARDLSVRLSIADLAGFYATYLEPLLLATGLDNLELAGRADLMVAVAGGRLDALTVELAEVYFDDGRERFRGAGLAGTLAFGFGGPPRDSHISWRGGGVYRIELGAGSLALRFADRTMRLREPLRVPVLDGMLHVDTLELENLGNPNWAARLDAVLEPLSLPEFCQAVGWPIMSGTLSGSLPDLNYRGGALRVGGALTMQVFDGEVVIRDLRLAELFGLVPRLQAEVDIQDLDLELLTRAFSFGKIEGRLDGYIHGLRMQNWQPVEFDAAFATPPDDDSRHRISQQAVDNLTRIGGGGATAALSRGFLGFLEEFSYDRLGIGCRLRNGVCTMRGVEHFQGGYAIVSKGLFPPWIRINGFNHRVDWEVLLNRLKSAVGSEGPIVR